MADPVKKLREHGLTPAEHAKLGHWRRYFQLPPTPTKAQKTIVGILILPNGKEIPFHSGEFGGPWGGAHRGWIPRGIGTGATAYTVEHVEGHAIATMFERGIDEAVLLVESAPCGACDPNISQMLPRGARLAVVDPESTGHYLSSNYRPPKPGSGLKGVAAGVLHGAVGLALGVLMNYLRGKADAWELQEGLKRLKPEIQQRLRAKRMDAAEIQSTGRTAYAHVTYTLVTARQREREPGAGVIEMRDSGLELTAVEVRDTKVGEGPGPKRTVGSSLISYENQPFTEVSEFVLSQEEMDLYQRYKTERLWLEAAVRNPHATGANVQRLFAAKSQLDRDFREAWDKLAE